MTDIHEMYIAGVKAALDAVRDKGYIRRYEPQYRTSPNAIEYTISEAKLNNIEKSLTGGN